MTISKKMVWRNYTEQHADLFEGAGVEGNGKQKDMWGEDDCHAAGGGGGGGDDGCERA